MTLEIPEVSTFYQFQAIPSTNQKAIEILKEKEHENSLIIATSQSNGRGRFNRRWESPEGGLYLSLILKPNTLLEKNTLLPLLSSLAVAKTINTFQIPTAIKWPNDVLVDGKKVAGILIESETIRGNTYLIVGMGINLNTRLTQYSVELRESITTLQEEQQKTVDQDDFLATLVQQFYQLYSVLQNDNFTAITDEWRQYSDTLGRQVKILATQQEIIGTALDIDESGFLIVQTESGEKKKIMSGDCLYIDFL